MRTYRALGTVAVLAAALLPAVTLSGGVASATHAKQAAKLTIVVTNDDGYNAPGIATLSSALAKLPDVKVTVVAPLTNQSGTGGDTTKGHLKISKRKTLNGMPAYAVKGYPADTIRAALDELHLTPDLVVSGINAGQNLGPAVDLSGTIGAARAAVARGIPAMATSAGLGNTIDFKAAVPYIKHWIAAHRARLLAHTAVDQVVSLNTPSCNKGSIRGLVHVGPALKASFDKALETQNCLSTKPHGDKDVTAFNRGFATQDVVPSKPAKS